MDLVKHFTWVGATVGSGRVAVGIDGDRLMISRLTGQWPIARLNVWDAVIRSIDPSYPDRARELSRRNRYVVARRVGRSGCETYFLITERDRDLLDYPTAARLHITMAGKFPGWRGWIRDWYDIVGCWMASRDVPVVDVADGCIGDGVLTVYEARTRMDLFDRLWEESQNAA